MASNNKQRLDIEPQPFLSVLNKKRSPKDKEQTVQFMQKPTSETSAEPDQKLDTDTDRSIIKPSPLSKYPKIAINSIEKVEQWKEETPHKEISLSSSFLTFEYSSVTDVPHIKHKETKHDKLLCTKNNSFQTNPPSSNRNNTDGTEKPIKSPIKRTKLSHTHLFMRRRSLNLPLKHRLSRSNLNLRDSLLKDEHQYKQLDIGDCNNTRIIDKPVKKIQPLRKKFLK